MSYLMNQISQLIQLAKKKSEEEPYYEVLQYISLDGTQYFDTGENADSTLGFECRYALTNITPPQRWGAIKQQGTSTKYIRHHFNMSNVGNKISYDYGLDGTSASENSITITTTFDTNTHELKLNAITKEVFFDGVSKGIYGSSADFDCEGNYYLGSRSGLTGGMPVIYYVYKLFRNGVLIKDYIPVLDNKMQPCLYDKVTKTFTYAKKISDGTTTYDLGFKRWNKYDVDYIENTSTAYIPFADITPTTTMGMNIEYAYTVLSSSEPAGVIGTYNGDTQRKDTFFVSTSSGSTEKASSPSSASCGVMVFHRGGNVGTSSSSSASYIEPEKDVWYKATVNWLGDGEITWTDGTNELTNNVGANPVITNQLRLFSRYNGNSSGTGAGTYNNCKARVRKLQFSDGNKIIRSFKPVVWHNSNTTAIATLYDEVYNKMMTPTGSLKAYITNINTTKTNVFTTTGATSGKAINEEGQIINSSASSYSALLPIVGGTVIDCVSGNTGNNNYRYHTYDASGNWIEQSLLLFNDNGAGTVDPVYGSFTAPLNAKYVRVSYATSASSTCTSTTTISIISAK